jgi:hypothetical protein
MKGSDIDCGLQSSKIPASKRMTDNAHCKVTFGLL